MKLMILAVGAGFVFSSCGEKKTESGDTTTAEKVAEVDTPEVLADEVMVEFGNLAAALKSVKDKASAEAAVKDIDEVGDAMVAISKRAMKIDKPSEEERKKLDARMEEKMKGFQTEMGEVMQGLMANPEAMQVIGGAMQDFGEKMKEANEGFERLGKDSN